MDNYNLNEFMEKYARIVVKTGVNIKKGQLLVISSPIECASLARDIARVAYEEGAGDVIIYWVDELFTKIRYKYAPDGVFDVFPEWNREFYIFYAKQDAAFIKILAEDPELLMDVDPERIARYSKARSTALKEYSERIMSSKNSWCVISVPTKAWARRVFQGVTDEEAVNRLWEAILAASRADADDPVAAWEEHKENLARRMEFLNSHAFKYLIYRNSAGTNLNIELPEEHLWMGGSDRTHLGQEFIANIPTEEVFTLPQKTGVNGTVVSSRPLNFNGSLIENFTLTFKDGRIINYTAEKGYEVLKGIIETDEGSHYLGEVALVPYDSPIQNSKILFYNSLYDENASCHLAIGKAYPCVRNAESITEKELEELGANDSLVHEDFMIGTEDLEIIGVKASGEEVPVFVKGNFAF